MAEKTREKTAVSNVDTKAKVARKEALIQLSFGHILEVFALIFGGCCSQVITLEHIIEDHPRSGKLVTFFQFLLVSVEGLFYFFDPHSPFLLTPPKVPLIRWILPVLIFFSTSTVYNAAWAYDISMPIHIIFKSSGTITTMIVGYLFLDKRYTTRQISAVLIITAGIIVSTWSNENQVIVAKADSKFFTGVGLLCLGSLLGALQGLVAERTYARYGKHWRETMFYTHFFSLVLFIPYRHDLSDQFNQLLLSKPIAIGPFHVPKSVMMLALNGATQYLCTRGVNKLAGHSSALTVVIILNIRKMASLIISAVMFGHKMTPNDTLGALMVFGAAVVYAT